MINTEVEEVSIDDKEANKDIKIEAEPEKRTVRHLPSPEYSTFQPQRAAKRKHEDDHSTESEDSKADTSSSDDSDETDCQILTMELSC